MDSSAFTQIKESCLANGGGSINEDNYRDEILIWLAKELPPTVDSPLEVVVLENDPDFHSWFEKYRLTVNRIIEATSRSFYHFSFYNTEVYAFLGFTKLKTEVPWDPVLSQPEIKVTTDSHPTIIHNGSEQEMIKEETTVVDMEWNTIDETSLDSSTDLNLSKDDIERPSMEEKAEPTTLLARLSASVFEKATASSSANLSSAGDANSCKV